MAWHVPKSGLDEDRQMMLTPESWPLWPLLPVKRYEFGKVGGGPECATLYDNGVNKPYQLYHEPVDALLLMSAQQMAQQPTKMYNSVDALLEDGWVVD
jgi:hypothetical protein